MAKRSTGLKESQAAVREREQMSLELHRSGLTYQQVADKVGFADDESARKAVLRCLERTVVKDVEELRSTELSRLDSLLVAAWPKAQEGDEKAIEAVLKIMDRRRKYIGGLETPEQKRIEMDLDERTALATSTIEEILGTKKGATE